MSLIHIWLILLAFSIILVIFMAHILYTNPYLGEARLIKIINRLLNLIYILLIICDKLGFFDHALIGLFSVIDDLFKNIELDFSILFMNNEDTGKTGISSSSNTLGVTESDNNEASSSKKRGRDTTSSDEGDESSKRPKIEPLQGSQVQENPGNINTGESDNDVAITSSEYDSDDVRNSACLCCHWNNDNCVCGGPKGPENPEGCESIEWNESRSDEFKCCRCQANYYDCICNDCSCSYCEDCCNRNN